MADKTKNRTSQAVQLMRESFTEKNTATACDRLPGSYMAAFSHRVTAGHLEKEARALMIPESSPAIANGEVVPETTSGSFAAFCIADTLQVPDMAAMDASIDRTDLLLLDSTNCVALAIDASQSIKAGNSLEKMLAHQLALVHKTSFTVMDKAMQQKDTVEQARLINASARLMSVYQQGLLTIQRLRTGGNQTMTVQHVHVASGGQAVIGNVKQEGAAAIGEGNEK